MNTMTANQLVPASSNAWWKEPYVWLVVGGPLVVVVAAIITAVIAFENADPVIDKNGYQQAVMAKQQAINADILDDLAKLQPAHQARNNAASPVVPGVSRD